MVPNGWGIFYALLVFLNVNIQGLVKKGILILFKHSEYGPERLTVILIFRVDGRLYRGYEAARIPRGNCQPGNSTNHVISSCCIVQ